MKKKEITISIQSFENEHALSENDRELVRKSKEIAQQAYAPYSQFYVGAALRLKNGEIITGSNQENVAYPSGLCAERVAMFYAGSRYPNQEIETIAVTAFSTNFEVSKPVSPCGACRQAMAEYELKQENNIRIIMASPNGEIYICSSIQMLLPFIFNEQDLKKI